MSKVGKLILFPLLFIFFSCSKSYLFHPFLEQPLNDGTDQFVLVDDPEYGASVQLIREKGIYFTPRRIYIITIVYW